jgi:hypothetical protein
MLEDQSSGRGPGSELDRRPAVQRTCTIRTRFSSAEDLRAALSLVCPKSGSLFVPSEIVHVDIGEEVTVVFALYDHTPVLRQTAVVIETCRERNGLRKQNGFVVRVVDPGAFIHAEDTRPPPAPAPDVQADVQKDENPFANIESQLVRLFVDCSLTEEPTGRITLDEIPVQAPAAPEPAAVQAIELSEPAEPVSLDRPADEPRAAGEEPTSQTLSAPLLVRQTPPASDASPPTQLSPEALLEHPPPPESWDVPLEPFSRRDVPAISVESGAFQQPLPARRPRLRRVLQSAGLCVAGLALAHVVWRSGTAPSQARSAAVAKPPAALIAAPATLAEQSGSAPSPASSAAGLMQEKSECRLNVTSEPSGAEVWIEQSLMGQTPLPELVVPCKELAVVLKRARYLAVTRKVHLQPGAIETLSARLPRPMAQLQVSSDPPGAEVWLDGQTVGTTPAELTLPQFERVSLELRSSGHSDWSRRLVVSRPKDTLHVDLTGGEPDDETE